MTKMNYLRGMGLGLIVGTAIGMAVVPQKKNGKNVICRALRSVGDILENITDSIG